MVSLRDRKYYDTPPYLILTIIISIVLEYYFFPRPPDQRMLFAHDEVIQRRIEKNH